MTGPEPRKKIIVRRVPTKSPMIATGRRPRLSASRPASTMPMMPGTPLVTPLNNAMLELEKCRSSRR